ncbi:hypothetical protein MXB_1074 [Myxobolus squamalis]|nr:hypothetical protein MXB_1074 [Myxobolus squamalis]
MEKLKKVGKVVCVYLQQRAKIIPFIYGTPIQGHFAAPTVVTTMSMKLFLQSQFPLIVKEIFLFVVSQSKAGPISSLSSKDSDRMKNGLFSCLTFSNLDEFNTLCAVGSYNKTVGLYDTRVNNFINCINLEECCKKINQYIGGVTQSEFMMYRRSVDNQQRVNFSFDNTGKFMIGGDTRGYLSMWPLDKYFENNIIIEPFHKIKVSPYSIPGCDFNRNYELVAMATGSRSFELENIIERKSDSFSGSQSLSIFKLEQLIDTNT